MKPSLMMVPIAAALSLGAAPPSGGIVRVAWLQGCWEAVSGERVVEEQWTAPRGDGMVGLSRTLSGSTLTAYELLVLREQGDRLTYQAHPSGQPSAVFASVTVTATSVVFENPQHDFPQRIGYERKGDGLLAWIEGEQKGKVRRVEFPYRRTACAAE
jgi:hypothetical protein